jgi:purine-binding chemotaxis protein CheW
MSVERELQIVVLNVKGQEFGIPIVNVQEIIRLVPVTKLPNSSQFVEGIINLRGKVIPIVDLRKRFGSLDPETGEQCRIVVVNPNEQVVGLIVDGVSEVLKIPVSNIDPPPAAVKEGADFITGIGKVGERLLILLDINRLFSTDEVVDLTNLVAVAQE